MMAGTPRRRFGVDRTGSIAPLVAILATILCGFAGLGIDLGQVYLEKRRVQSAVDLAALAAARAGNSPIAASRSLFDNGYRTADGLAIAAGTYLADRAVPAADRFTPAGQAPNATRVRVASTVRTAFARIVGGPASFTVSGEATAMRADLAAFGLGSRLVGVDGGIANALLSRLLGTAVSFTIMDYRALASLRVDALGLLRGAASRLNLQAGTYDDVLKSSLPIADVMALILTAAEPGGATASSRSSLNALTAALSGAGASIRLAGLLTAGELGASPVSQTGEALWVNALDLITGTALLANSANQVSLDLGATLPGLARTRVTMRVGEAWRTSGFVGLGGSLSAAQQRVLVEFWIPGPLALASLYLPVYVELAPARTVLKGVTCPWNAVGERSVKLDVATGVAYLAVGQAPPGALDLGSPRPSLVPTTILEAPLVTVTGAAALQLGSSTQSVTFTDSDIRAGRVRTVSTNTIASSLTASLLTNIDLQVNGLGLPGLVDLRTVVSAALSAAAAPIDTVLASILTVAGVQLGSADVAVTGTRCGGAVLVQ
ncbi:pilus assembly protein TadG-related protein [Methylobacterium sp. SyP6R]|uniref:pilus assembly protein TadG-related protein n=1 Tax=Methylobacterium sp. SyP6R TaxID=2718876 RepID=UPI001F44084A|nr:pilus assembly protein TadG-related protein [Methylobacterium sp. SyP6R]MCF4128957.1 pilus assembly protein TadG-related protein [Methylobacterium sp. SyP6R]